MKDHTITLAFGVFNLIIWIGGACLIGSVLGWKVGLGIWMLSFGIKEGG